MKFKQRQPKTNVSIQNLPFDDASTMNHIFMLRGVDSTQEVISPISKMLSPSTMKSLDTAAQSIIDAIGSNKRITIVADYDCDGACACAIMIRGLIALGADKNKLDYIVPNRIQDGYGLTPVIVDRAIETFNTELLITVDNGIASFSGINHANEKGIDVIVTDHHLPSIVDGKVNIPGNAIIVNPQQPDCPFESKSICGAGVAFYLILMIRNMMRKQMLFINHAEPKKEIEQLLQLVAVATIADVVLLDDNNRCLIANGLRKIQSKDVYPGLEALFRASQKDNSAAISSDIGFVIAPRINAAGRMSDMKIGIKSLIIDDPALCTEYARQLNEYNNQRKTIQNEMSELIDKKISTLEDIQNKSCIVVHDCTFHEGVVGILAGRLKEKYNRPTFAFANSDDGFLKGSGRSIAGLHLRDALDEMSKTNANIFIKFGGHSMAAGCTIKKEYLSEFHELLERISESKLNPDQLNQTILTDGSLCIDCFSPSMCKLINSYVWGNGFEEPIFFDTFKIINQQLLKGKHLKMLVQIKNQRREAIWFGVAKMFDENISLQLAYKLSLNKWQGRENAQMNIVAGTQ